MGECVGKEMIGARKSVVEQVRSLTWSAGCLTEGLGWGQVLGGQEEILLEFKGHGATRDRMVRESGSGLFLGRYIQKQEWIVASNGTNRGVGLRDEN